MKVTVRLQLWGRSGCLRYSVTFGRVTGGERRGDNQANAKPPYSEFRFGSRLGSFVALILDVCVCVCVGGGVMVTPKVDLELPISTGVYLSLRGRSYVPICEDRRTKAIPQTLYPGDFKEKASDGVLRPFGKGQPRPGDDGH